MSQNVKKRSYYKRPNFQKGWNFRRPNYLKDRKTHKKLIRPKIWPKNECWGTFARAALTQVHPRLDPRPFSAIISHLNNSRDIIWVRKMYPFFLFFKGRKRNSAFWVIRPIKFSWKFGFYFFIFGLIFWLFEIFGYMVSAFCYFGLPYRTQKTCFQKKIEIFR